ncbi:MAG: adenylate/guanylate cyclase domain-containing protein [Candidatus Glassbacteria bacterium]|nr:adenylate/guanylate cyclase domain-containing protein [Candidatus Glassbacteria bacterium]
MISKRKLLAIMFTDIIGYTDLMSKNEQTAIRVLRKNRKTIKSFLKRYGGEWLKEIGDGTLSSFPSVVNAVNCALAIQRSLKSDPEFSIRIGIHMGDVVIDGSDIYGDGVNIASRLEPLAQPGGICISGRVYNDIRNQPGLETVYLGKRRLKNVPQSLKIYNIVVHDRPVSAVKAGAKKQASGAAPAPAAESGSGIDNKKTQLYESKKIKAEIMLLPGKLEVLSGDKKGELLDIHGYSTRQGHETTIGREARNDDESRQLAHLQFLPLTVHRKQAKLFFKANKFTLINLGLKNPVKINGRKMSLNERADLSSGDEIQFGEIKLRFIMQS